MANPLMLRGERSAIVYGERPMRRKPGRSRRRDRPGGLLGRTPARHRPRRNLEWTAMARVPPCGHDAGTPPRTLADRSSTQGESMASFAASPANVADIGVTGMAVMGS